MKILLIVILLIGLTVNVQADIGGEIGVEYSYLRDKLNWFTELNYTYDRFQVGFTLHNWTTTPQRSNTPPYIGFGSWSVKYTWTLEMKVNENVTAYVDRYCEHWFKQADMFEDYVGVKTGVKYEF